MIRKLTLLAMVSAFVLALTSPCVFAKGDDIDFATIKFPKLNEIKMPEIQKVTLDNGIRLYIVEDRSLPVFNVSVRVAGGSYLEPADRVGLASLTGQVMRTGGCKKWSGDELDELLEGIGGAVETNVDEVSGGAYVNVLSEYTDLALEVLADVLRNPVFDEEKLDLAKTQERSNISRRNDDPATLCRTEFRQQIYGEDSPWARINEYTTIDAISHDDLVAFHQMMFQPQNIQMAIWGDFDTQDIITRIKQHFGDWPKGTVVIPPPPQVDYNWRGKVYLAEKTDAAQSFIRMGHITGMPTDPDHAARLVASSILGGSFGSRLTDNVRTKLGLGYSVGGNFYTSFDYPGYFFAAASTGPGTTLKAAKEMMTQITSMTTTPPSDKEMAKGKDGFLNSFVFNFDSRAEVVNRMMEYDFHGVPDNYLQNLKQQVEEVTPEAVLAASRTHLRPSEMVVFVLGNPGQFDEPLTALGMGEPEMVDITIPTPAPQVVLEVTPENLERGAGLLAKSVAAHGGLANFKKVKSLHSEGRFTLMMQGQELPLDLVSDKVFPDKEASVYTIMGHKMYDITSGNSGWKTDQATMSIVPKTPEDIADYLKEDARDELKVFQRADDPNFRVVYNGEGEVNGVPVVYIAVLDANGESACRLGLNAESHQLVSKEYWGETPMGEGNVTVLYSDFKTVAGVTMPMKMQQSLAGQTIGSMTLSTYDVNANISPTAFDKPQ